MMDYTESNKLIAEFDGKIKDIDSPWYGGFDFMIHGQVRCHGEQLKYHTSFDWLMPVVEKLENDFLLSVNISRIECDIYWMGAEPEDAKLLKILEKIPSMGTIGNTKLQAVYSAVLQFIHFYNKTKLL